MDRKPIPVLVKLPGGNASVGITLLKQLRSQAGLDPASFVSTSDLSAHLKENPRGVVLFPIQDKTSLSELLGLLQSLQASQKDPSRSIKVLAFDETQHPKVPELLKRMGCAETIEQPIRNIKPRALQLKIEKLVGFIERAEGLGSTHDEFGYARLGKTKAESADSRSSYSLQLQRPHTMEWVAPDPSIPEDFWLLEESRPKRVRGHWIFNSTGPGPAAGFWTLADHQRSSRGSSELIWRWAPREVEPLTGKDLVAEDGDAGQIGQPFRTPRGSWFFRGRRPEFLWSQNVWQFCARDPELRFEVRRGPQIQRIHWDRQKRHLTVAKNSEVSSAYLPLILATVQCELHLKLQAEATKGGTVFPRDLSREDAWNEHDLSPEAKQPWNESRDREKRPASPRAPERPSRKAPELSVRLLDPSGDWTDWAACELLQMESDQLCLVLASEPSSLSAANVGSLPGLQKGVDAEIRFADRSLVSGVVQQAEVPTDREAPLFWVHLEFEAVPEALRESERGMERRQQEVTRFLRDARGY